MLLICVSWQHCSGAYTAFQRHYRQVSNKRETVTQVLQAREICSANPTEGQSSGPYNFAVPPIPEAGEQGCLASHIRCSSMHLCYRVIQYTIIHPFSCDADSDADEFTVMEERMWADVKKPTWEEGSHDSSSSVSTRAGRMYLPEYTQKVGSNSVRSEFADPITQGHSMREVRGRSECGRLCRGP